MAHNKTLRIYSGLRGYWYITFLDEKGIERHLPVVKKLFGKWKEGSCLRAQLNGHRADVYRVSVGEQPDPAKVLSDFVKQYPHVSVYLRHINKSETREKVECG
ncbi:MAG TPA: hypothetical protein VJ579_03860 [Candidatus Paceibacterota bacterium]|nr:hypothetical protein [Candidatus Paceibacterota bacterium]